ncbi:adenylate/guanylate cyclase domain-containing protein [Tengunoibacter tsumagoiensis]|uniref:Guanylate cyclase domain-containing protein n=1 Tax=Tengunoibacter tsumagoiensis TaxID=2014871 RepID=A0A402AAJ9_9CHLR|nr:adenylate/guanylate cyclase domain-containing protein [Tengunoibacter tsumagoiensis]GCE15975.1 hypothetical protein KTT_58340 [Tengunoibacter tsumagoiensis]
MSEERKLVTILFADVVGSTALGEMFDAEDVRALMNRYYDHARRIIVPRGGTLEKFIGDAVMAIFGLSQVHDDDPERALASALALRDAIAQDEILNRHFNLRIGVNTGVVVATNNPDRLDFLVTGDAVNVSARLQQGATPGEILVSERTAQAARSAYSFHESRLLQAKGKQVPLTVFPLEGRRSTCLIERPPFVGRLEDLLQLKLLRLQVVKEQHPQVAQIIAPAGTGKTRLIEEFLAHLQPSEGFKVAFAPCLPYGQTLTYWPMRGLLSRLLGQAPEKGLLQTIFRQGGFSNHDSERLADLILLTLGIDENDPSVSTKQDTLSVPFEPKQTELHNRLSWLSDKENLKKVTSLNDLKRGVKIINPLAVPPRPSPASPPLPPGMQSRQLLESLKVHGADIGTALLEQILTSVSENLYQTLNEIVPSQFLATNRESLFEAWRILLELLAQKSPHILVFEDLHWASDALFDLIAYLSQRRTKAPILFLVIGRPELLEKNLAWQGRQHTVKTLLLQPLPSQEIQRLLLKRHPELPESISHEIAERSGGNPFFALELLHVTREQSQHDGQELALPDTIHATILARLDQLLPLERMLLQRASVVNRTLSYQTLQVLSDGLSDEELHQVLESLQRREMLVQLQGGQDSPQYVFRHALIRDIVYGTLSRTERARLHSQIALWLEALASDHLDEYIELIAYHYREAFQLSRQSVVPQPLPFNSEHAALALERAGLIAGRAGSYSEARQNLQLAIELASGTEPIRLYEELAESLPYGETSFHAYQKALDCWRADEKREPLTGARLLRKILMAGSRHSHFPKFSSEQEESMRSEALALVEDAHDQDERWRILLTSCFDARFRHTQPVSDSQLLLIQEKRELARQAVDYFERVSSWEALSEALDAYGCLSTLLDDLPEALEAQQRRLTIPNLPIGEWEDVVSSVSYCFLVMGRYHDCLTHARQTFANLKPDQPLARLGRVTSDAARAAYFCGEWDELEQLASTLDEIYECMRYDQSVQSQLVQGYHALLLLALARENHDQIPVLTAKIQASAPMLGTHLIDYLAALVQEDVKLFSFDASSYMGEKFSIALLLFFNEHRQPLPAETLAKFNLSNEGNRSLKEIAMAIQANDNLRLACAIDAVEAASLVPHAARMRVVLAEQNGDMHQLQLARPVLEHLGDRQFLRRLKAVIEKSVAQRD